VRAGFSKAFAERFQAGLDARRAGNYLGAHSIYADLLAADDGSDTKVRAMLHRELGYVSLERGEYSLALSFYERAVELRPRAPTGSLGLFHTLLELGRTREALEEMLRFVRLKDSAEYRELLSEGFAADLPVALRWIADAARVQLGEYVSAPPGPHVMPDALTAKDTAKRLCDVELAELDDRLFVEVSGVGYHVQWTAENVEVLERACRLLETAPSIAEWDQVELGRAFGRARVLLVVDEGVVRFRVLDEVGHQEFPDLTEVTLRDDDRLALLHALAVALQDR